MAHVSPYATDETIKKFKRRIYEALLRLANNESTPSAIRIVRKFPGTNWELVWKILQLPWFRTPQSQHGTLQYMASYPPMTAWLPSN